MDYAAIVFVVAMLAVYLLVLVLSWPGLQVLINRILGL